MGKVLQNTAQAGSIGAKSIYCLNKESKKNEHHVTAPLPVVGIVYSECKPPDGLGFENKVSKIRRALDSSIMKRVDLRLSLILEDLQNIHKYHEELTSEQVLEIYI